MAGGRFLPTHCPPDDARPFIGDIICC
jgi:hypothetical protein